VTQLQIFVDRDLCLGAQNCKHIAPDLFEIDDEGLAVVISSDPAREQVSLEAAHSCPSGAISVAGHRTETSG
jgi:ferredoxin